MNELQGFLGIAIALCLILAGIIMPIFIIMIDSKVSRMEETLAKMEHMMRHGK